MLAPRAGHRFGTRFPTTRFTVIYASAEYGVLLKTHRLDGWYEADSLSRDLREWRVAAGVLELRKDDRWVSTGDCVERMEI